MSLTEEDKSLIESSIERVAEIAGDPAAQVYARLFAEQPEMRKLFVLDRDDSAKGHMLAEALDCVFDVTVVWVVEGFRVIGVIDGSVPCGVLEPLAAVRSVAGGEGGALGAVSSMVRGVGVRGVWAGEEL